MQSNKKHPVLIYTPNYAKHERGLNVYAIYPDYWGQNIGKFKGQHNWGEVPCLGYVRETSEYWAKYAAFTGGIIPANATFQPKAVLIKTKNLPPKFEGKYFKRKPKNVTPGNKI